MLADAPEKKRRHERENVKKLNSNLIRLMPSSSSPSSSAETADSSRNSLNPHHKKRRNRNHKVTDNRTGFSAKERRRHRLLRKCRDGNENACRRLENQPKNNNKDLIRSLDRRSSKKEKLSRKERRKLRRQEKRHKRRERKRQRRRKMMKKNKKNKREKRSSSQCRTKFIDSCSWPHCNRSCPKLKNPETGQEIDFLSLLKSFGLEMSNVARAIGVDINTLNNMDKDVLLELLTSSQHQHKN